MVYCLSQHDACSFWLERVKVNADWYFENCYFRDYDDATAYFSGLYRLRFRWMLIRAVAGRLIRWRPKPRDHGISDTELDFLVLSVSNGPSGEGEDRPERRSS
jgi:hypothetical protein